MLGRLKTSSDAWAALINEYSDWKRAENLDLGRADEPIADTARTPQQQRWLREFVVRYDRVNNVGFSTRQARTTRL